MKILKENTQQALLLAEKKLANAMEVYRTNKEKIPAKLGRKFQKLLDACLEFLKEFKKNSNEKGKIYG
ncbi:MAG: hypothetical protein K5766_02560 [Alphaproteobacteria bacterium]|nr:hypothetical protein [Alphaproteobacteria bacterium]MCR4555669.1 hypothetical protein [Alphaproteobacteria bacterium]